MTAEKDAIRAFAKSIGFDVTGFTAPDIPASAKNGLASYLENGYHGDMGWMQENQDRRSDPRQLWQEVRSVIVVGHNYGPDYDPMDKLSHKTTGNISCYAGNQDYHDIIKKKLKGLAGFIAEKFDCEVKLFVDTAPILEKPLAEKAGLGWQGKHSCVVSREFGSWLFLGEIFTTLELPPDVPHTEHCGSCTRCLDICPTGAFVSERVLDARKCISYLTIEHKGHIDGHYRKAMGNRIYGCDDCLAVCPWNRFAKTAQETAYHPRTALQAPLLAELARLDDAAFRQLFSKSPVKRIGRNRFIRNVLIAIGNSGDKALLSAVVPLLRDESELVRAMCIWAIRQLAEEEAYSQLRSRYLPQEKDEQVKKEWDTTCASSNRI